MKSSRHHRYFSLVFRIKSSRCVCKKKSPEQRRGQPPLQVTAAAFPPTTTFGNRPATTRSKGQSWEQAIPPPVTSRTHGVPSEHALLSPVPSHRTDQKKRDYPERLRAQPGTPAAPTLAAIPRTLATRKLPWLKP